MVETFAMTDASAQGPDYSDTLFLPKNEFPMRAGPAAEESRRFSPAGEKDDLYGQLRKAAPAGRIRAARRPALRQRQHPHRPCAQQDSSRTWIVPLEQMGRRKDSNYVPGWDCHAWPIDGRSRRRTIAARARCEARFQRRQGDGSPSAANAAPPPTIGSRCSARSSSGSAWCATGTIRT